MKLIMSPTSPYVRKVRVLIHEAGITDQIEEVSVVTHAYASDSAVIAANPLGKIPALVRAYGPTLYDSRVITRFLDVHAGTSFYPEARIWEVLTLEATADGIMDCTVSMAYERKLRPEAEQSDQWVDAQWDKAARGIAAINARWMSHLAGPLDITHIAVACALGYVDFRHGDRGWRNGNAALATWYDNFAQRDALTSTQPV